MPSVCGRPYVQKEKTGAWKFGSSNPLKHTGEQEAEGATTRREYKKNKRGQKPTRHVGRGTESEGVCEVDAMAMMMAMRSDSTNCGQ
jgi:hypothetical protein